MNNIKDKAMILNLKDEFINKSDLRRKIEYTDCMI